MATKEKKTVTERREGAGEPPGFWQRLNAFGEQHAKVIIAISSLLVVLTVIIFAKVFYDRTLNERAARDLAQAENLEQLQKLKEKYKDTPVAAQIVYRLGNRYYDEGRLEDAEKEYTEFKTRFPNHPLKFFVDKAYTSLVANRKFLSEEKEQRLKIRLLQTHPEDRLRLKELLEMLPEKQREKLDLMTGPVRQPNPELHIEIAGKGTFWVELYEDDAPNTVSNFLKLVEQKAFDGQKFARVGDLVRTSKPVDFVLEFEKSEREAKDFMLAVRKAPGREYVPGAEFEILLKPHTGLPDLCVFGEVTAYTPVVQNLSPEDSIKSITVKRKRDAAFDPKRQKKNPEVDVAIGPAKGSFTVELFQDEAPNTVANFLKQAEGKAFDGVKLEKTGEILKVSKPSDVFVPFEKTPRAAKEWTLVARKIQGREDVAGVEFEILLKDHADLKDGVVFGRVVNSQPFVATLTAEDTIKTLTVIYKRDGR